MNVGKMIEVDIRELWEYEQYDFSKWLAEEKNIEILNDVLGISLTDIAREAYVGLYRCDIVAKDEISGSRVIIENQLETSNHDHLGKIITYASGLDAKVIVWIVKKAREEHRSAIEWLNNNTNSNLNFFLIEIHAYKIDDSRPAPMFKVIEQPNDFIKYSKTTSEEDTINKTQSERLAFWNKLNEKIEQRGKAFRTRKPNTDHFYDVAIGTSKAHISITLVNKTGKIGVGLWIANDKELFDKLYERKNVIENEIGYKLEWDRKGENQKASSITTYIKGLDFDNHSNYEVLMDEIIKIVTIMIKVFKKYI